MSDLRYLPLYLPNESPLHSDAGGARRQAKARIRCAMQRETSVLFFCAVSPKDHHYLAILECTTPARFQRRKDFWENEGFHFHPQVQHSGHFHAKPHQVYTFDINGNIEFLSGAGQRLTLTFNPRSYKYQSFYLSRVDRKLSLIGEINIYESKPGEKKATEPLTNLPIDIPEQSKCILSWLNSVLNKLRPYSISLETRLRVILVSRFFLV